MSKTEKSEALVLRRFRQGETSLIVHAFTRTHGRIPFIARGARRGGKRPPVPLVQVALLELIWSPSTRSELQLLRDVSLLDGFGAVHSNLDKLIWAQAGIEVLSKTLSGTGEHEALFSETLEYLRALSISEDRRENLFSRFTLVLLRELGFGLDFSELGSRPSLVYYDPEVGRAFPKNTEGKRILVHPGTWKLLETLSRKSFVESQRLLIGKNAAREIRVLLDALCRHHFERWTRLESLKLLDAVSPSSSK